MKEAICQLSHTSMSGKLRIHSNLRARASSYGHTAIWRKYANYGGFERVISNFTDDLNNPES